MAKKVLIITEDMEKQLINFLKEKIDSEKIYPDTEKVLIVKKYLDDNFTPTLIPDVDDYGMPIKVKAVIAKNGQNTMSLKDLFFMTQEKFKKLLADKNQRDKLLKQIINDWTSGKITKEGNLSVNFL